ncbi:hypothetical protein [Nocardioides montaniterrae]
MRTRGACWEVIGHGVAIRAGLEGEQRFLAELKAWAETLPASCCFTGLTAARLYRLWLPPLPASMPSFIAMPADRQTRRSGSLVVCRHTPMIPSEVRRGLRVATVPETLLACAREVSLLDLVVLVDSALHLGRCSLADLEGIARCRRRGAPRLREALRWCDRRSESPWETLLRVLLRSCDIPVVPQAEARDRDGRFVARADLLVAGTRTLEEYDGAHHRDARTYARDRRRDSDLMANGFVRHGWVAREVVHDGWRIYVTACRALGREPDFRALETWKRLLAASRFC